MTITKLIDQLTDLKTKYQFKDEPVLIFGTVNTIGFNENLNEIRIEENYYGLSSIVLSV